MRFERRLAFRDCGTNLQHVSPEHFAAFGMEMIGVVLHERRAAFQSGRHDFHGADQGAGFPIAFRAKAITVGHQPLRRHTRQLLQSVQIFKCISETFETTFFEERA